MRSAKVTVTALIRAIYDALQSRKQLDGVQQTISRLDTLDLDSQRCSPLPPKIPLHFEGELKAAVDHIPASLKTVAEAFSVAAPYLSWNAETDSSAGYYEAGEDVGQSFLGGNLVCRLVGPSESFFLSQDLFLSLFFLKPRTLYRDHADRASEMYFNLTGPCGLRLGDEDWVDYPPDSVIWNPPSRPHATRVYRKPFLSAVSWVSDLDSVRRVVSRDDWQEREVQLQVN